MDFCPHCETDICDPCAKEHGHCGQRPLPSGMQAELDQASRDRMRREVGRLVPGNRYTDDQLDAMVRTVRRIERAR